MSPTAAIVCMASYLVLCAVVRSPPHSLVFMLFSSNFARSKHPLRVFASACKQRHMALPWRYLLISLHLGFCWNVGYARAHLTLMSVLWSDAFGRRSTTMTTGFCSFCFDVHGNSTASSVNTQLPSAGICETTCCDYISAVGNLCVFCYSGLLPCKVYGCKFRGTVANDNQCYICVHRPPLCYV